MKKRKVLMILIILILFLLMTACYKTEGKMDACAIDTYNGAQSLVTFDPLAMNQMKMPKGKDSLEPSSVFKDNILQTAYHNVDKTTVYEMPNNYTMILNTVIYESSALILLIVFYIGIVILIIVLIIRKK